MAFWIERLFFLIVMLLLFIMFLHCSIAIYITEIFQIFLPLLVLATGQLFLGASYANSFYETTSIVCHGMVFAVFHVFRILKFLKFKCLLDALD